MSTSTDLSEVGRRLSAAGADGRRERAAVVRRIVAATRAAQDLPPTVRDIDVLDRVAALLEQQAET